MDLSDIFEKYKSIYFSKFKKRMLSSHIKAYNDICQCRTISMGGHICECDKCKHLEYVYHSCCNRNCPKCHGYKSSLWFEKRKAELLPVNYFHMVFTVPKQVGYLIRSNQKLLDVLMRSSAYSLKKLALDPKYLGGKISILSVLHTWTRTMVYHPHVHCLVPAGGVSENNRHWLEPKSNYFLPVKALSRIFKGKFLEQLRKEFKNIELPKNTWNKSWVVYCKPGINGSEKILQYLSRYVSKIAITNNRIIAENNGTVTFKYKKTNGSKWKIMRLDSIEFIRRYLQHVLHRGFHRIRYYGLFSPSNRPILNRIQNYLNHLSLRSKSSIAAISECADSFKEKSTHPSLKVCPKCKEGLLIIVETFSRQINLSVGRSPPCHVKIA